MSEQEIAASPEQGRATPSTPEGATPGLNTPPCDSHHLLQCLKAGSAWLDANIAQVNALNVFPVPDGDTGTNMSLTMRAALAEAENGRYDSVGDLIQAVAHGALMGARGNSGVILSQILRGFARVLHNQDRLSAHGLAEALTEGAVTAYKGVMKPVEGTILTVAREAAEAAAQAAKQGASIEQVLRTAEEEARASLARTPSLLPVLAAAGVVDAGGAGFALILQGMLQYTQGRNVEDVAMVETQVEVAHPPDGRYNYDTQFIIRGEGLDIEAIRLQIANMGDSVLVVGDEYAIKVHVHTNFPGRVLDYAIAQGQITSVIIENMQLQYEAFKAGQSARTEPQVEAPPEAPDSSLQISAISVVAVASGEGLKRVFESLGVSAIVPGGQTMNPSTQDLLQCIERVPGEQVILLPNNSNIILTAEQAKALSSKQVRVVPTKTVPQGIAALLAFNYQADLETNYDFMVEASHEVQTIEITKAVRSVQVNGLAIIEGQIIGLLNDDLATMGGDVTTVAEELLRRIDAQNYEIVTIYYGENVSSEQAQALAQVIRQSYPDLEVEVLDGGQPHYYCIISVE